MVIGELWIVLLHSPINIHYSLLQIDAAPEMRFIVIR